MLKIGRIQDSSAGAVKAVKEYKVVFSTQDPNSLTRYFYNENHIYGDNSFKFYNLFSVDSRDMEASFNFLKKPFYITSQSTSLIVSEYTESVQ